MLGQEPCNTFYRDNHHLKLAHDDYTGRWNVFNAINPLSFMAQLNGR